MSHSFGKSENATAQTLILLAALVFGLGIIVSGFSYFLAKRKALKRRENILSQIQQADGSTPETADETFTWPHWGVEGGIWSNRRYDDFSGYLMIAGVTLVISSLVTQYSPQSMLTVTSTNSAIVIGLIFDIFGVFALARSLVLASAISLKSISGSGWGGASPSREKDLALRQVDAWSGLILLAVGFLLQIFGALHLEMPVFLAGLIMIALIASIVVYLYKRSVWADRICTRMGQSGLKADSTD